MKMAGRPKISLHDRFFEKVEVVPEAGCWIWNACTNKQGYGKFMYEGRPQLAHRISWRINHGFLPDSLHVLHKCDTPACVNPGHLFLGTDKDNVQDMLLKNRVNRCTRLFGETHGRALMSNEKAIAIFKSKGTQNQIANVFGVSRSTVNAIKSRRNWRHITKDI